MKYLFFLGHPAHFHLFKNLIDSLTADGHHVEIVIKTKDVLEELLQNRRLTYINILSNERKNTKLSIANALIKKNVNLLKICLKNKPDLLLGTAVEICHVGTILKIRSIIFNEDDVSIIPQFGIMAYPFVNHIISPTVCNNGYWEYKTIKYNGYHELAYLHPNHFTPSRSVVEKYFSTKEPYAILRFSKLQAYHDKGIQGLNDDIAERLIGLLQKRGKVFITSERILSNNLEKFRVHINPIDIHHVLAFAYLYIGDSQTMAAESGVLGTPFIRFNDFVGRIGYLRELEDRFKLGFGISPKEPIKLFEKVEELSTLQNLDEIFNERKEKMLKEKIDASQFFLKFIEKYTQHNEIISKTINP